MTSLFQTRFRSVGGHYVRKQIAELLDHPDGIDTQLFESHPTAGKIIGAICAGPTVLLAAGILPGPRYTGHFSIVDTLPDLIEDQDVVVDENIITSRGAGTAVHFGLALVRALAGEAVAAGVAASIHH